jgi:hypothetical protein
MSYNRKPQRPGISGLWVEYILIVVLIVIVVAIISSLFGPYISNQVTEFLNNASNIVK